MLKPLVLTTGLALIGAAILWSTYYEILTSSYPQSASSARDIPGNSGLQHCDNLGDPYDPDTDIFDLTYLQIEPNPLILHFSTLHSPQSSRSPDL
ncbi:hypothetical protein Slin15195_G020590 [Septoria linicola]|uniref:Uncharacterized protein n=1 Tax=Septoria linicola TaxID=215465 RepID=A0A9Q9AGN8_9PEZI|nr:hypothetical protein Slin15195_G020590 [Septoria linicola]